MHAANYINFWTRIFLVLAGEIWHFHRKVWHFLSIMALRMFGCTTIMCIWFSTSTLVFEHLNSIFWWRKSLTKHFFIDDQSIRRFGWWKMRWHDPMCDSSHCHGEQWFVSSCLLMPLAGRCPRMPLSHGMSHDDLALSLHERHQCSMAQRLFLEDLREPRLLACVDHNWIH